MTGPEAKSEHLNVSESYSKKNQRQILKKGLRFHRQHQAIPFDVIFFALSWHLAGNSSCMQMSCDHELASKWARWSG